MRNTPPAVKGQSAAVTAEWNNYWAAYRAASDAKTPTEALAAREEMARTYSRIERLQLAEMSRRTTVRTLAATLP